MCVMPAYTPPVRHARLYTTCASSPVYTSPVRLAQYIPHMCVMPVYTTVCVMPGIHHCVRQPPIHGGPESPTHGGPEPPTHGGYSRSRNGGYSRSRNGGYSCSKVVNSCSKPGESDLFIRGFCIHRSPPVCFSRVVIPGFLFPGLFPGMLKGGSVP